MGGVEIAARIFSSLEIAISLFREVTVYKNLKIKITRKRFSYVLSMMWESSFFLCVQFFIQRVLYFKSTHRNRKVFVAGNRKEIKIKEKKKFFIS